MPKPGWRVEIGSLSIVDSEATSVPDNSCMAHRPCLIADALTIGKLFKPSQAGALAMP
jgi:hypothetical protein